MIGIITKDHYFKFMGTPYHRKQWLYDCWVDILRLVNHSWSQYKATLKQSKLMGGWATWWNTGHWTSSSSKIERKLRPGNYVLETTAATQKKMWNGGPHPTTRPLSWRRNKCTHSQVVASGMSGFPLYLFCFAIGAFELVTGACQVDLYLFCWVTVEHLEW